MNDLAPRDARYSFWFLLAITVASGLLAELVYAGMGASGLSRRLGPFFAIPVPAFVAGAVLPYLLIRFVYRSSLRDFGVYWRDPARPFVLWLLAFVVIVMAIWIAFWGVLMGLLAFGASSSPETMPFTIAEFHAKNPLHGLLHRGFHAPSLAAVLYFSLVVGFVEELFGRGYLQNALDRRYKGTIGKGRFTLRVSTLLAAVLFAFWHTEWLSFKPLDILGSMATSLTIVLIPSLLLAVLYEKTRSMLAVIILHNVIDGGKLFAWEFWSWIVPG